MTPDRRDVRFAVPAVVRLTQDLRRGDVIQYATAALRTVEAVTDDDKDEYYVLFTDGKWLRLPSLRHVIFFEADG
jgi:hypothetical protein